jgi:DNA uptake protein ComE-like DNA-binding protein
MTVPGIGAKVADKILELREAKGDLELDDLNQVPYLSFCLKSIMSNKTQTKFKFVGGTGLTTYFKPALV